MQAMDKPMILFDFDGVIVDSFSACFEVGKIICPHLTEEEYRSCFNGNINDGHGTHAHSDACRHDIEWISEYIPRMKQGVAVVPGMEAVISQLAEHYRLMIVSSSIAIAIQDIIDRNNLTSFFAEIMDNKVHKSKVEKIHMVFTKYNTNAKNCVFVTDTLGDFHEATRAGVGTIGVSWGFHDREWLSHAPFFRIVDRPEMLGLAITDYFTK